MLDPSFFRRMALLSSAVFEMAVMVVIGTVAGYWLDDRFGTSPLLLAGLSLGGLAIGIFLLSRTLRRLEPPDDPHDTDPDE